MRRLGNGIFSLLLGLLPLAVTTVAACSSRAHAPVAKASQGESGSAICASNNLERFTGKVRSQQLGTEILRQSGASAIRWVPEGTMVTMEFREERVTVHLDSANRVRRAVCG